MSQLIVKLSHNNTNMRILAYSLAQELQQIFPPIIRTHDKLCEKRNVLYYWLKPQIFDFAWAKIIGQ